MFHPGSGRGSLDGVRAIAAGALGFVKSTVSVCDELLGPGERRRLPRCRPAAYGGPKPCGSVPRDDFECFHPPADFLSYYPGAPKIGLRQDDYELFASVSSRKISRA